MKFSASLLALGLIVAAAFADESSGDAPGKEQLHQEITLTATTNAPGGATGMAMLDAETDDGVVMAIAHRDRPIYGIQFHPESYGTEGGDKLIANFLAEVRQ